MPARMISAKYAASKRMNVTMAETEASTVTGRLAPARYRKSSGIKKKNQKSISTSGTARMVLM